MGGQKGVALFYASLRRHLDVSLAVSNDNESDPAQEGAPSFVVNTSDDHDDGTCGTVDCTLREAIDAAGKLGGIEGTPDVHEKNGGGGGLGSMLSGKASTPGAASVMQSLGSAFAQGFAQTFLQQMREAGSTPNLPQTR